MESKPTLLTEDILITSIISLLENGRNSVVMQTNSIMTLTYFEIGKHIVEFEQQGNDRAKYAKKTLENLSKQLTSKFGKGFSTDNLERMRRVYKVFQKSLSEKSGSLFFVFCWCFIFCFVSLRSVTILIFRWQK